MSSNVEMEEFCRACGRFATGIAVASVLDEQDVPHGMTVNSFTSVSLDPPLILICLAHTASALAAFREVNRFAINILREDQEVLSAHFARPRIDHFDGVPWERGASGTPLIPGVLATLECQRVETVTAGDHDIFIAEVIATCVRDGRPLLYFASRYRTLEQ
jgi:flavin reductase (DIM6/NTAB) family NADH-FMN oxidoreductase RutF